MLVKDFNCQKTLYISDSISVKGPVLFSSNTRTEWPAVHRKDHCNLHFLKSFSMSYINHSAIRKPENFLCVSKRSNSIQGIGQTQVRQAEETSRGQWWDPDVTRVGSCSHQHLQGTPQKSLRPGQSESCSGLFTLEGPSLLLPSDIPSWLERNVLPSRERKKRPLSQEDTPSQSSSSTPS